MGSPESLLFDGLDALRLGDALEVGGALLLEADLCAVQQIPHRPGPQDLVSVGLRRDARADDDRQPTEMRTRPLDLADVSS